jgi:PAS domain S-box-containing protein
MVVDPWSRKDESAGHTAEFLVAIIDSSHDAIIGKELDGSITSWNKGAESLYGYTEEEMLGRNVSVITPENLRMELADILARIGKGERIEHHETQRVAKDGTVLDISITISPIRDATGALVGASAIGRNISERMELERDRSLLEGRLRQSERLESLGQLAGGIAHDFNNLLAVILNYSEFVKRELDDKERALADLDEIHKAAECASALTRQLLAFARREALQSRVVNLNDLLAGIEQLLRRTMGAHIEFVTTPSGDLWSVVADPGQLEQVLMNLTVNACDAMAEGGLLSIDTENVEIDPHYAEMFPGLGPGRYVRLRVNDTGVGIAPSVLEHVFEPFFTTKPRGEGTGLGLSTVYGIVTQAGGEVQMYSEPGVGTTCQVLLPASDRSPSVIPDPIGVVGSRGTETILVVEDEDALREMTRRILEENGYEVLVSANGPDAMIVAQNHDEIHLLLSDVIMPQMSGLELAAQLQALRPGLLVLHMSGYAQPILGQTLGDEVMLLEKPFSEQLLLSKVREALDRAPRSAADPEQRFGKPYGSIEDPVTLRRILDATLLFDADLEMTVLLRHVVEEACSMTGARYGALGVLNDEGTELVEFITVGLGADEVAQIGPLPSRQGILGILITDPVPLRLAHLATHAKSFGFPPGHPPMTSFLGVPIKVHKKIYGNLYLTDKVGWSEFTSDDESLIRALASAAGLAIEKARLHG